MRMYHCMDKQFVLTCLRSHVCKKFNRLMRKVVVFKSWKATMDQLQRSRSGKKFKIFGFIVIMVVGYVVVSTGWSEGFGA